MNGLPPIDVNDHKMLPAVYRRSDIIRSTNATARQSFPERPDGHVALANDEINSNVYNRSRNNSPVVVKASSSYRKGLIVDVWA